MGDASSVKVTLRIEEGEKLKTDNVSEAIRISIMQSLATED